MLLIFALMMKYEKKREYDATGGKMKSETIVGLGKKICSAHINK